MLLVFRGNSKVGGICQVNAPNNEQYDSHFGERKNRGRNITSKERESSSNNDAGDAAHEM